MLVGEEGFDPDHLPASWQRGHHSIHTSHYGPVQPQSIRPAQITHLAQVGSHHGPVQPQFIRPTQITHLAQVGSHHGPVQPQVGSISTSSIPVH